MRRPGKVLMAGSPEVPKAPSAAGKLEPYQNAWELLEAHMQLMEVVRQGPKEAQRVERAIERRLKMTRKGGDGQTIPNLLVRPISQVERLVLTCLLNGRLSYNGRPFTLVEIREYLQSLDLPFRALALAVRPEGRLIRRGMVRRISGRTTFDHRYAVHPGFLRLLEGAPEPPSPPPGDYGAFLQYLERAVCLDKYDSDPGLVVEDWPTLDRVLAEPVKGQPHTPFHDLCRKEILTALERRLLALLLAGVISESLRGMTGYYALDAAGVPREQRLNMLETLSPLGKMGGKDLVGAQVFPWNEEPSFLGRAALCLGPAASRILLPAWVGAAMPVKAAGNEDYGQSEMPCPVVRL